MEQQNNLPEPKLGLPPEERERIFDPTFKELGPNDKRPPRKIPVLKIIISSLVFCFLGAVIISAFVLLKDQNKYQKTIKPAASKIQAVLSPYPKPEKNFCGNDSKICPSGNVVTKKGVSCAFDNCPETSQDMTKFWTILDSEETTRTYENLDLKYEFSAPSNWQFIGKDSGFILYSPNFTCKIANNCNGSAIQMTSSLTTEKNDIEDWYLSSENIIAKNSGLSSSQINNYSVKEIAGLKMVVTNSRENSKTYYFLRDNNVYILDLKSSSTNDFMNGIPIFEDLTAGIKFVEN